MTQLELNTFSDHEELITRFVDVILPVPLPKLFTYRVPFELIEQVEVGSRVIVQFGKKKILTAIIARIHEDAPTAYEAKYILELLDDEPIVNHQQLKLFAWMADYYMCNLGEVINAALPAGFKLSSQSRIQIHPDFEIEDVELAALEELIIEHLSQEDSMTYDEVATLTGRKSIASLIKSLLGKQAIILFEEVKEKYVPKRIRKIRLRYKYTTPDQLEELMKLLEKKPKQLEVVLRYLQKAPVFEDPEVNHIGVEKATLVALGISTSSLKTLVQKEVFEEYQEVISRFPDVVPEKDHNVNFNQHQAQALDEIIKCFETKNIALLHGVTGSGKTELYIDLIKKAIENGTQVLYLLPEIALSTQIVTRLRKIFGDKMGIYHSRFSDNERVETWKGIISGRFSFVVGVRSAVFLPFDNLGLVIVDEEHDSSYKQFEPSPRYQARDVALMLGQFQGAKVLLGSATPSVESYHHAQSGNWGLIRLTGRFGKATLPQINLVENKSYGAPGSGAFSKELLEVLANTISKNEQAIIFQNRRGYSPFMTCDDCNTVPMCENCNVSLTYHYYSNELRCHYCGYTQGVPTNCSGCGSRKIKTVGHGTEKIEEDLRIVLPQAIVERMDYDTTRRKNSYEEIIASFSSQKTNVLVGTQMVSKGLDFDNVSLVGVFDADRMMSYPDFRANERAFQMMTQVSGRAGRKDKPGQVIIQTANPKAELLHWVINHDYSGFLKRELFERKKYGYPPFARIIKITVKHANRDVSNRAATQLTKLLQVPFTKSRVLGPEEPIVNRIRNLHLTGILLKFEREATNLKGAKVRINQLIDHMRDKKDFKGCYYVVDVDPA